MTKIVTLESCILNYDVGVGYTKYQTYFNLGNIEVRKGAKIRNRCNEAPQLTQDTNGKVITSQFDISL